MKYTFYSGVILASLFFWGCNSIESVINSPAVFSLSVDLPSQKANPVVEKLAQGQLQQKIGNQKSAQLDNDNILILPDEDISPEALPEVFNLPLLTSTKTLSMSYPMRSGASLVKLADGQVIVIGGNRAYSEIYNKNLGLWTQASALLFGARRDHFSIKLNNNKILTAGGSYINPANSSTAMVLQSEVYDPNTNQWIAAGSLNTGRTSAQSVLLDSGDVLVVGGLDINGQALSSVEKYNTVSATWANILPMNIERSEFSLLKLDNGKIFVSGGFDANYSILDSSEIYDPQNNSWTLLPNSMNTPKAYHKIVQTTSSTVLIMGGLDASFNPIDVVEEFNLNDLTYTTQSEKLQIPRYAFTLEKNLQNEIFIFAGFNTLGDSMQSVEKYNIKTKKWTILGGLPRTTNGSIYQIINQDKLFVASGFLNTAPTQLALSSSLIDLESNVTTLLPKMNQGRSLAQSFLTVSQTVVVFSGKNLSNTWLTSTEIFNFVSQTWTTIGTLKFNHNVGSASLKLKDGKILLTGGSAVNSSSYYTTSEVFNPATNQWTLVAPMNVARSYHKLTLLSDGKVLAVGGRNSTGAIKSTEIYDPVTNLWMLAIDLKYARYSFLSSSTDQGHTIHIGGLLGPSVSHTEIINQNATSVSEINIMSDTYNDSNSLFIETAGKYKILARTNNKKFEILDTDNNNWFFLGGVISDLSFDHKNSLTTKKGEVFLVTTSNSDDVIDLYRLRLHQPVKVLNKNISDLGVVNVSDGGGWYDQVTQTYYPPVSLDNQSSLTLSNSSGLNASTNVQFDNINILPAQLSASSTLNFSTQRLHPIQNDYFSKKIVLNVILSGSLFAQSVSATITGSPAFKFSGNAYPGTGGTCRSIIHKNCTLVLAFQPITEGAASGTIVISYFDGETNKQMNISLIGSSEKISAANNVLVVYNSSSSNSIAMKNYYLSERPEMSLVNTIAVSTTTNEIVSEANYNSQIENPIVNWLQTNTNKNIQFIVLMYGMPSRTSGGSFNSVIYRVSRSLQDRNIQTGTAYEGSSYATYSNTEFKGTTALITMMNMGSVSNTVAYIDKLKSMWNDMPEKNIIISAQVSGRGGTNYLIQDAQGYAGYPIGQSMASEISYRNPTASVIYRAQNQSLLTTATNVSGFFAWGVHAGLPSTYAVDGTIILSGLSNWFLVATAESYNGQSGCGQGCMTRWYSANAWGGVNYSSTPAGTVGHVEEPYVSGINGPKYFSMWQAGFLFSEAAWASRLTPFFMAVGDPLLVR